MNIDYSILKYEEKIVLALRSLYSRYGYIQYKMSKFEEYDLYVRNKDFLVSDNIITFNDTNGRLMALKPDVTLSIIKNTKDAPDLVQKLYYTENVYRAEDPTEPFREILQVGLECIGDLKDGRIHEVLYLAAESLHLISGRSVLCLSHPGILSTIFGRLDLDRPTREEILKCFRQKNRHQLIQVCGRTDIPENISEALCALLGLYGTPSEVLPSLEEIFRKTEEDADLAPALRELSDAVASFDDSALSAMLRIDFSLSSDLNYYNGIVFRGFIPGIPSAVLSGGSYDQLMSRLRRRSRAIGFAVYMNVLDRLEESEDSAPGQDTFLNIALPKGRLGEKVYDMFAKAGFECPSILENSRKLIFENPAAGVRYFWAKPSDVSIYVERGVADIGVAGKDILLEYTPDVFEMLDLGIGKCRMCVAAPKDFEDDPERTLRVATKFKNIARNYYTAKGRDVDFIHLNGSIEIAPILGLSDVIVDIVETGTTLKENDLEVREEVVPISARLIANKASFKFKSRQIERIMHALTGQLPQK